MSTATLMFNLLAGTVGAVAVWLAVRALCARLAGRGKTPASGPARTGGRMDKQTDGQTDAQADSPEAVARIYRRVLARRLGGLLLCLAAFGAWLAGAHWSVSLLLAGAGCLLQYLAYRLRTCYALAITRQRQAAAEQALGHAPADGESENAPRPDQKTARLTDGSSSELLHSMGKGL